MMSQILHSDVCFKDQASVETSGEVFISRYDKTAASGGKLLQAYVNQDDPNHLVYLTQREPRERQTTNMNWASAQSNTEQVRAWLARPPREVWLSEMDG